MSNIWIAGTPFRCSAKVIPWFDAPFFSAIAEKCLSSKRHQCRDGIFPYSDKVKGKRKKRYAFRPRLPRTLTPPLAAAQAVIRQLVVHFDGCPSAKTCFRVLHDERGLSCHFLIDNDGTIYQTLDLALMGFHAAGFNAFSVGVEFSNRGDAKKYPGYYHNRSIPRSATTCRIHNHTYLAYEFTDSQLYAFRELSRALRHALPNVPLEYPQDKPGRQSWSVLPNAKGYSGYIGHYHQTRRKWDPGPFDFKKFIEGVRGQLCFPLHTKRTSSARRPEVPQTSKKLLRQIDALYRLNEVRSDGGYFPVGPFGMSRLWHGGVHLTAQRGAPVYAPFPGRIVAARMGGTSAVGSTNFVLLRHDMTIGSASVRFFSLYFHLQDENIRHKKHTPPKWLQSKAWKQGVQATTERSKFVLLDEPIQSGAILGHVGEAGPAGNRQAQIHFEIFSREEIMKKIDPGPRWKVIDGTVGGRFSTQKEINNPIDTSSDGILQKSELSRFFRSDNRRKFLRDYAVLHVSEWTASPDWSTALQTASDYSRTMSQRDIQNLVDQQIAPTLWWTKTVARHAGLPKDGIVFHYNPITFLKVVNERLLEAKNLADVGLGAFSVSEAQKTPEGVTDDREDEAGESFFDAAELTSHEDADRWPLERLVDGFQDP